MGWMPSSSWTRSALVSDRMMTFRQLWSAKEPARFDATRALLRRHALPARDGVDAVELLDEVGTRFRSDDDVPPAVERKGAGEIRRNASAAAPPRSARARWGGCRRALGRGRHSFPIG